MSLHLGRLLSRSATKTGRLASTGNFMQCWSSVTGNLPIVGNLISNSNYEYGTVYSEIFQEHRRMLSSTAVAAEHDIIIEDDIPFPTDEKPEGFELIAHSPPRGKLPRGALVGCVVSTKMQKTVNVAVDRFKIATKYRKRLKYTRKFMAHDEIEECNEGDIVMITPCRKMSKNKHFEVAQIMRKKGTL